MPLTAVDREVEPSRGWFPVGTVPLTVLTGDRYGVGDAEAGAGLTSLSQPVDHVLVTGEGQYSATLAELDFVRAQRDVDEQLWLPLRIARAAAGSMRPGGTLLFFGSPSACRGAGGLSITGTLRAARSALIANLALEISPIRVNLIGAGFVDRPLSARLLSGTLHGPRSEFRERLPIARVVRPTSQRSRCTS